MKRRILFCILIFVLLLTSCNKDSNVQNTVTDINSTYKVENTNAITDEFNLGYINNIIILLVEDGVEEEKILSWFQNENPEIVGKFSKIGQYQVRINPRSKKELEELAENLMEREEVLFAHLDLAANFGTSSSESYPDFSKEKKPEKEWWYELVGLEKALESLPKDNLVKVGVVDDGFDIEHKDLKLEFINDEQKEENSPEVHGTHVAGIVQQILPASKITVIDSHKNPDQKSYSEISTQSEFLKYLVDMVESDVKVINFSMGDNMSEEKRLQWSKEYSGIASVYIWKLKQMGYDFIIVQSAGNSGVDAYYNGVFSTLDSENTLGNEKVRKSLGISDNIEEAQKSVLDSLVIVASIDLKNPEGKYHLLPDSNYGNMVTIAAPGYGINSAVPGGYMYLTGTSQAAPIVTGTLGLLWSVDNDLTSGELKNIIVESSDTFALDGTRDGIENKREEYPIVNIKNSIEKVVNTK